MKIKINTLWTERDKYDAMKEAIKEFKARYTENDLVRFFCEQTGSSYIVYDEIITCSIEVFNGIDDAIFDVTLVTDGYTHIAKTKFYCDIDGNVDTRDVFGKPGKKLYSQVRYTRQA